MECDITEGHTAFPWLQPGHQAPKHTFQVRVASAPLNDNYKHTVYLLLFQLCSPLVYIYYYLFSSLILVTSLWGGCHLSGPFYRWENRSIERSHSLLKGLWSVSGWTRHVPMWWAAHLRSTAPPDSTLCSPCLPSPRTTLNLSRDCQPVHTGCMALLWPHFTLSILLACRRKALGLWVQTGLIPVCAVP